MKTVVNKAHRPLRVPLPQGKVLHLGPGKSGQIADHAIDHEPLKKLIAAGDIEVRDERAAEGGAPAEGGSVHAETHGHHPNTNVRNKGDR